MTTRTVPLLAAAALTTMSLGVTAAGARTEAQVRSCGTVATANGGKAGNIKARKIGCRTAKAVARRATGKPSYKASGFVCQTALGPYYLCLKRGTPQRIVFNYKKR